MYFPFCSFLSLFQKRQSRHFALDENLYTVHASRKAPKVKLPQVNCFFLVQNKLPHWAENPHFTQQDTAG